MYGKRHLRERGRGGQQRLLAHAAKSRGDFYRQHDELMKLLGPEAEGINQRLLSFIRRVEHKEGWLRPDLSYPAPETAAKPTKR